MMKNRGIAATAVAIVTVTNISLSSGFITHPLKYANIQTLHGDHTFENRYALPTQRKKFAFANDQRNAKNLKMAAGNNNDDVPAEVAKMRAAAAKLREDSNRLAKEMGKEVAEDSKIVETKKLTKSEILSMTSGIDFTSGDPSSQSQRLDDFVSSGDLSLWKSATRPTAPTNLRTFPVTLKNLETRSDGKLTAERLGVGGEDDVSLDDFKYALLAVTVGSLLSAVASLVFLPENVGATFCYVFASIPILFLGVGSSAPGIIAAAIQVLKGSNGDDNDRNDRICRHEAGHFLCGYLCGLPVKNYQILDTGFPCVEFHPSTETDISKGKKGFTDEEIAALSVVALSGSVAETLQFEQAKGGDNDLLELDNLFRRSANFIGAAKQQDMTRWGALIAYQLIKANMNTYEELVQAFKNKNSIAECIAIIESVQ